MRCRKSPSSRRSSSADGGVLGCGGGARVGFQPGFWALGFAALPFDSGGFSGVSDFGLRLKRSRNFMRSIGRCLSGYRAMAIAVFTPDVPKIVPLAHKPREFFPDAG